MVWLLNQTKLFKYEAKKNTHRMREREIHTQLNDSLECNSVLKKFGYSLAKHIEFQKSQTKLANYRVLC